MKKKSKPQFSPYISGFCRMMEDAQKDYAWNYDEVSRMDRLTQDYLHKLELETSTIKNERRLLRSLQGAGNNAVSARTQSRC